MNSQEKVFLDQESVKVTTSRAVIGSRTYAMSNITSVSVRRKKSRNCLASSLLFIGLLSLLGSLVSIADGTYPWSWFIVSALLIGAAIFLFRPIYELRLASASGEISALQSTKRESVQAVALAVESAIIRRG